MSNVSFGGDTVVFAGDIVVFGPGGAIPFPTESGLSPVILTVAGVAVPHDFTMQTEEVLGGTGAAVFRVQDRLNSNWEPVTHQEVIATVRDSGWRLFKGEIINPTFSIPVGAPFRIWTLQCRDYNATLDEKLVGAPDGVTFTRETTEDAYRPIDGFAVSSGTDETTVQSWLNIYHRLPDSTALNDTTYVNEYIPIGTLGDAQYVINLFEAQTTLRSALETLASIADVNVQFWIDPDDNFHWQAIPDWRVLVGNSDPTDLDAAPYALVDEAAANGTTTLGHQGIDGGFDGSAQPEVVYVTGANTYVRLASGDAFERGSGWYPENPSGYKPLRQAYLSVPGAWTKERKDSVAASAIARALDSTLRGSVGVRGFLVDGEYESRDGWRVGQLVPISDARLPATMYPGGRFVIQRVVATIYPGTRMLRYQLDIGDGPTGRMSQYAARELVEVKPKVVTTTEWVVDVLTTLGPIAANEERELVFMPRDGDNSTWGENGVGVPMSFRVVARDSTGTIVPSMGSFSPTDTVTDADGKLRTTFTAGSQEGLTYRVTVVTVVAP